MLRALEIAVLNLLKWFYSLPDPEVLGSSGLLLGVIFLGVPFLYLIYLQYTLTGNTTAGRNFMPGMFGMLFGAAWLLHLTDSARALGYINGWLGSLENGSHPLPGVPVIEPLVSLLISPTGNRYIIEESLFVLLVGYIGLVVNYSWAEYKKTGVLVGDLSVKALVKSDARRPTRSKSNELGSGDLATTEQIAKWTKPSGKPADSHLYVNDLRGSEGTAFAGQTKMVIPGDIRNRHVLIVAKTGSGKSTKFIYPIIYSDCLDPVRSSIVIDSKPEMWRKFAAMTRKYNPEKKILLFNPLDRARSLSWNILGKCEDDTDCKLIANTIIMATDQPSAKGDSPFFRQNALSILNSIMVGLLHDPNDKLSVPRIHELVQSGMKPLCDWLEAHPAAIRNTRTFVELARSGSQNADTIMSELSMRLGAWDLTAIRATTYFDELDIEDLISEPTLFIVELRESELEMLRPMANVIVVELLRFLTKRAEQCPGVTLPRPVSLVIDEFASALGRLPDIHVKLNTLRSRNVSIIAAIQSTAQIKANYNDDSDSVLAGFSSKIFMPALDLTDAEWASKESGQMTIRFKTATTGGNKKITEWFASRNDSTAEQVQQRAVLTPDEIGRPADNICTFFMPGTPVFQGHLIPHFKIPEMLKRMTEFDSDALELKLRTDEIPYEDKAPQGAIAGGSGGGGGGAPSNGLPAGITNTAGWSDDQVRKKLEEVKKTLDWDNTTGSARKWWEAFENENQTRMPLVLRLAEELQTRTATITEFFLAYVYSNTDNIQANLSYLDYTRLKKEEERKKKEAAKSSTDAAGGERW